ncbi:uncharacterized protein LOC119096487 [Pollicipes pollicipes]|uniref:uncharacterized protein LOC119096487 n=1 Tax=Pollicipes pollicipes TaxID=41117 RepID=UPI0018855C4F|nr:uncharacterized protein LOC119096487 [Pollicipes pollicipes]
MGRKRSSLRYRPYSRRASLHLADPEIIDDDEADDSILVVFEKVCCKGSSRPPFSALKDDGRTSATVVKSALALGTTRVGTGATVGESASAVGTTRVGTSVSSNAGLPTEKAATTSKSSEVVKETSGIEKSDETITPASDVGPSEATTTVRPGTSASPSKGARAGDDSVFSVTALPSPSSNSFWSNTRRGPTTSTPAPRRRHDSDVVEVTPHVVTLEDGELADTPHVVTLEDAPTELEVTEVRRVYALSTPAVRRRAAGFFEDMTPAVAKPAPATAADLSADFLPLATARPTCQAAGSQPPPNARAREKRRSRLSSAGVTPRRRGRSPKRPHRSRWDRHASARPRAPSAERRGAPGAPAADIQFNADFRRTFAQMLGERAKRPVIIDGPNVAYAHGRNQTCSVKGLTIALDYFKSRGHRCVVFMPSNFHRRIPSLADRQVRAPGTVGLLERLKV